MTDPIKSTSALQFADLGTKLAEGELGLPEKVLDKFCNRIFDSIRIFLEIDEPKAVEKQIKLINRFAKKKFHNGTLFKVIENASPSVLTLMEELSPLPVIPKGEDVIEMEKFRRNIRERLVIGFVEKSDRWENRLIGPKTKGRPPKSRVDVLVSLIAGAYVLATSKMSTAA